MIRLLLIFIIFFSGFTFADQTKAWTDHMLFLLDDEKNAIDAEDFSRAAARYHVFVDYEMVLRTSANSLANLYLDGRGVNQDTDQAIKLFIMAAKDSIGHEGYGHAATTLGWIYLTGDYPDAEADYIKALRWNLVGSQLKHTNASANLALIYAGGFGVEKNLNKTIDYFVESIDTYSPEYNPQGEDDDWKKYLPDPDPEFLEVRKLYIQAIETGDIKFKEQLLKLKS